MARYMAATVGTAQRIDKERRITHYGIVFAPTEILHTGVHHRDAMRERRHRHILFRLSAGTGIDVDCRDGSIGKALRHHQGNKSRARANVEHAFSTLSPCPEQCAVGSNLHRAAVLTDGELPKTKEIICHSIQFIPQNYTNAPKPKH